MIAGYLSDEDPDYVPNGVTEESAEEDSDVDVGEEKEGDDIEEIKEVVDEVAATAEISREEAVSKIRAVVEKTVLETEDITEAGHIVGKIVDETNDKIEDVVEEVVREAEEKFVEGSWLSQIVKKVE